MSVRLTIRMAAPSVVISLLLLAVGVLGGWYVHRHETDSVRLLGAHLGAIRAGEEMAINIRDIRFELLEFARGGPASHLDRAAQLDADCVHWLEQSARSAHTEEEAQRVVQVRAGFDVFRKAFQPLRNEPPATARTNAGRLAEGPLSHVLLEASQNYLDLTEEVVAKGSETTQQLADRVALGLLLLGTCGSVAGLVAGFGIAHTVSRSIVQLYVPIRDATGKLEEVVGPLDLVDSTGIGELDVLLRRLSEQVGTVVDRLHQSQLEVLRSEQMAALGQLAAGLAHELRNPLTSIKILVQAAQQPGTSASLQGRDLEVLEEEIGRLETAIGTFLDFARPRKLQERRFDLRGVVRQTFDLVRPRAEQQGVDLRCDLPEAPVEIWADPEPVRQVILNLLLNALDAMPSGGTARLDTVMEHGTTDGSGPARRWVSIRVLDTGSGIPVELGDRIFLPFVSTKEAGLGLGLAICRRIAEDHGGTLVAANAPGGGAEFTLRLPVDPMPEPLAEG
jgi:two-component system, NtrC family, sensor histidine kinase HydH